MTESEKHYARYPFVRGYQAFWRGHPSQKGAQYRQVVITSDEWMLTEGKFQVHALEGSGNGIEAGKFSAAPNPTVLFDGDYDGANAAEKKFQEIVAGAESEGFKTWTQLDEMEFHAKLNAAEFK